MLPDRVSNPGPLTYESGALPIALRGLANIKDWTGMDCASSTRTAEDRTRWKGIVVKSVVPNNLTRSWDRPSQHTVVPL